MNGLIVHGIVYNSKREILVIRRCKCRKGGKVNFQAEKWDFPGGTVEENELPKDAIVREVLEEVGLTVELDRIVYEFSNYDEKKNKVFTTLVYSCILMGEETLTLNFEEHDQYQWISIDALMATNKIDLVNYVIPSVKNINR